MLEDVRLLTAGFCRHPEAMTFGGAGWSPCRFPAGFALIRHRRHGAILFDTGYSDHFLVETRRWPNRIYAWLTPPHVGEAERACRQVAAVGVAPSDVRHIVVSHFHADHIAGLRDFPAARILCTRAGWRSVCDARGLAALARGFLPGLLPQDVEARLRFVDDQPEAWMPESFSRFRPGRDVLGDGSLIAVDLPGHAVGQIGLLIRDLEGGPLFLVADAAWSRRAVAMNAPPPRVTTDFLGETAAYRATLARLHALHRVDATVRIVPSHCAAAVGLVARG